MAGSEIDLQREYYARTAQQYESMHVNASDEHFKALTQLVDLLHKYQIESVLDVGSGTGRALHFLKEKKPGLKVTGIEPVHELRQVGYAHGLSSEELKGGDATRLELADGSYDLVCEFGVLHHIRHPELAVKEMLRVARKVILISDSNNFGQGSWPTRTIKQCINAVGIWPLANWFKTGGKGYQITKGDGLAYSYSVFNNLRQIQRACSSVEVLDTHGGTGNVYRTAAHVTLIGIKK